MLGGMATSDLNDAQWGRRRPLLPPQKPRTGRPANDHRTVINGILWILRTGSPWRSLPERYGSWKTVSSGFYCGQKSKSGTEYCSPCEGSRTPRDDSTGF